MKVYHFCDICGLERKQTNQADLVDLPPEIHNIALVEKSIKFSAEWMIV